jgi:hypothetical protein
MKDLFPRYADPRNWPGIPCFFDRFMAMAEGSRAGLRQLLGSWFDFSALRSRKAKKSSYRPEIETLEMRWLPTLSVFTWGFSATAGQAWPTATVPPTNMGSVTDFSGWKGSSAYAVTIAWGDGTPNSPGSIQPLSTAILGSHTYCVYLPEMIAGFAA